MNILIHKGKQFKIKDMKVIQSPDKESKEMSELWLTVRDPWQKIKKLEKMKLKIGDVEEIVEDFECEIKHWKYCTHIYAKKKGIFLKNF